MPEIFNSLLLTWLAIYGAEAILKKIIKSCRGTYKSRRIGNQVLKALFIIPLVEDDEPEPTRSNLTVTELRRKMANNSTENN